MDQGQPGVNARVGEVSIEMGHLTRQQEALVDKGPAGEATNVKRAALRQIGGEDGMLDPLPDDVERPLEVVRFSRRARVRDERLSNDRHRRLRDLPRAIWLSRHVSPAQQAAARVGDDLLKYPLADRAIRIAPRQEEHTDAIMPW